MAKVEIKMGEIGGSGYQLDITSAECVAVGVYSGSGSSAKVTFSDIPYNKNCSYLILNTGALTFTKTTYDLTLTSAMGVIGFIQVDNSGNVSFALQRTTNTVSANISGNTLEYNYANIASTQSYGLFVVYH